MAMAHGVEELGPGRPDGRPRDKESWKGFTWAVRTEAQVGQGVHFRISPCKALWDISRSQKTESKRSVRDARRLDLLEPELSGS